MPRTSSASRARRIRRIGLLGLLLTTLLTPAGIIVSTVTAAALIGGAFHLSRAEPETADTPTPPVAVKTGNPQHLDIGRDGKTVALVIAEDTPGQGSDVGGFDPANPLFAGLAGNGPAQPGMPSGRSPGKSMPAGGFGPDSGGPATPPGGKGDPDETDNEEDRPNKPGENVLPPLTDGGQPAPDRKPPDNAPPRDPVPGPGPDPFLPNLPTPPLAQADTPLDTQAPPPGKQLATQPNAVPEPSMLGLMLLGVAALVWSGRRRPDPLSPA